MPKVANDPPNNLKTEPDIDDQQENLKTEEEQMEEQKTEEAMSKLAAERAERQKKLDATSST